MSELEKLKVKMAEADAEAKSLKEQNDELKAKNKELGVAAKKRANEQRQAQAKSLIEAAKLPEKTAAGLSEQYGGDVSEDDIAALTATLKTLTEMAAEYAKSPVNGLGGGQPPAGKQPGLKEVEAGQDAVLAKYGMAKKQQKQKVGE